jgi:hypothetical protein
MSQLDETVPGGLYLDVHGTYRDAWGKIVEPPVEAAQHPKQSAEQEIKKPSKDEKRKNKEVTDE